MLSTVLALVVGGVAIAGLTIGGGNGPGDSLPTPEPTTTTTASGSLGASTGGVPLVAPRESAPAGLAAGRTLGRADAPVTLVVWSDFQCPSCAAFAREVQPKLVTDFILPGTLRIVYRDDAFIGQESIDAAVAARCAADQDRFWPYHDYLFWNQGAENSGTFDRAFLDDVAQAVGLDMQSFDSCLGAAAGPTDVAADTAAADTAGVKVTPTLQIGGTMMPGAPLSDAQYSVLKQVIERTLAGQ